MAKVLLADDDKNTLSFLKYILEKDGHDVTGVENGKIAIEKALQLKPDIILLDVMMPIMDGFQALKILKSQSETKNIPVIVLTSKNREIDVLQGLKYGALDYMLKPFSVPELLLRIKKSTGR